MDMYSRKARLRTSGSRLDEDWAGRLRLLPTANKKPGCRQRSPPWPLVAGKRGTRALQHASVSP